MWITCDTSDRLTTDEVSVACFTGGGWVAGCSRPPSHPASLPRVLPIEGAFPVTSVGPPRCRGHHNGAQTAVCRLLSVGGARVLTPAAAGNSGAQASEVAAAMVGGGLCLGGLQSCCLVHWLCPVAAAVAAAAATAVALWEG